MTTINAQTDWATPGSDEYASATATFNVGQTLRPRRAVTARDVSAVREVVARAAAQGEHVIPITTGHAAIMIHQSDATNLLKTLIDGPIEVDAARGVVTFPTGTLWAQVVEAAAAHGFAVPHGSSGTVGAVGYLLGGGVGFYGRALGVAANHVESLRVVTADGEERHVDADTDPDLFWAVRGGGGGFGIVTSVTLRMVPLTHIVTGMAVFPIEHGAELLETWRKWAKDAPTQVTTTFRLLELPPIPGMPPQLTSGQVVVVDGAVVADGDDVAHAEALAAELLEPLRAVAVPTLDTWHTGPVTDLLLTHGDPDQPVPSLGDSFSVAEFTAEAAAAWFAAMGPDSPGTHVAAAELRQLGGALRTPRTPGGAFDRIEPDVLVLSIDLLDDLGRSAEVDANTLRARRRLAPWVAPWTIPTLVDKPTSPRRSFPEEVEARVDAIRRRVDPEGVFRYDHRPSLSEASI